MEIAERMQKLGTETAFEVLARAKQLEQQGADIIHLEIGEPDFETPANVIEAGANALRSGATHYTPSAGIEPLRQAIANDQIERKGVNIEAEQVVVVPGGKPIIFYLLLALAQPGDEVIYPDPGFPIYESMVNFSGATGVPVGFVERGERFEWNTEQVLEAVNSRTKLIIVNTPSNPVGCSIASQDLERIAAAAVQHDAFVLSDEIYSRILYDDEFVSLASFPGMADRTCILDGFSKTYAMTGWRLGYGILPLWLAPQITRLVTNCNSCTATAVQLAGVEALTGPQTFVDEMVVEFRRRRDLVVSRLNGIAGVRCAVPQGAFYAFPNISDTGFQSREAADKLLYDGGVAVLSGTAFGKNGEGYLRLSYANSYENLERALDRIEAVLQRQVAPVA